MEKKSWIVTQILVWFLGAFGIHRFYTGYIGIGILQLLTFGGCGIWTLIDFISISINNYRDAKNNELDGYNKTAGYILLTIYLLLYVVGFLGSILMTIPAIMNTAP